MTDNKDGQPKKVLTLSGSKLNQAQRAINTGGGKSVGQQFSHGRVNEVLVTKRRTVTRNAADGSASAPSTDAEKETRLRALQQSRVESGPNDAHRASRSAIGQPSFQRPAGPPNEEAAPTQQAPRPQSDAPQERSASYAARPQAQGAAYAPRAPRAERGMLSHTPRPSQPSAGVDEERRKIADRAGAHAAAKFAGLAPKREGEDDAGRGRMGAGAKMPAPKKSLGGGDRRGGRLTVNRALNTGEDGGGSRVRSEAAWRRSQQKKFRHDQNSNDQKIAREVILPETITVQELANRMAERGADVVKTLMKMGVLATINQVIDADTAELVATEFGHKVNRVSESDVELGLGGEADNEADMISRPPVVTIMGHVDHGKTSLLDAIRKTDVVAGESGGITQHIGAYQVQMPSGQKITFLDTPGHAAFSEMRARGANVTDVVVLVVAADDSIMPQTIEAISHARAAKVPIVVAINKVDKPGANPDKVKQELLQYEIQVEDLGGDILCVEVSAKTKQNLDKLEEAILLQAEILDLKVNPNRPAVAVVVEAKQQIGRGAVATVLVQKGTLRSGDLFVSGTEWGRVRSIHNDHGKTIHEAGPGKPVEVTGLTSTPQAGDDFVVVENEAKAREIAEYRGRKRRELLNLATARSSLDQMFTQIKAGDKKELSIIIKGDVHGSIEAIASSVNKIAGDNTEVAARVLHTGVGAINESDITLAKASQALVIGFNVRANPQARDLAKRENIDLRYYSVIYNIIDDIKALLTGLLKPKTREKFLGNAEIRQVFTITGSGKIAGCYVTEGMVKRGAKVRLLRDSVVIHEGTLKTLKRFKEDVREVKESYECGMAFEKYEDIREGDIIEAFELEEVAQEL